MIVITPGHDESRHIFYDAVHSKATEQQYDSFGHYGYYSTELYELSQAAPVFDIGDPESDGCDRSNDVTPRPILRRYLNYVNFPSAMWYEKFNWDLYSCSNTKDRAIPAYSISYHYTLGHRSFFLPTHWFSYKYFFVMNDFWLSFRRELNESFFFTYLWLLALLGFLLAVSRRIIAAIASVVSFVNKRCDKWIQRSGVGTAIVKLVVAGLIGVLWNVAVEVVPYYLLPEQGYLFFFLFYSAFLALMLLGFSKGTAMVMGIPEKPKTVLGLLLGTHAVIAGS